jgi:hypothetical protein
VVGKRVVKDKNGELTVELHQPEVSDDGETLDVNFTFSHTPEDQTSTVRTDLSGYRVSSTDYAVNTWIIGGKKRYLPGRNADNDCACTRLSTMDPGTTTAVGATFAVPDEDKVTIHLENVVDFKNVELKR